MSLKDYLYALDRHKSIDNCFLSPSTDDRLYFFDEIKKITNHLFKKPAHAEPPPNTNNGDNRVHDMNKQNLHTTTTQTTSVDLATESSTCHVDTSINNKINDVAVGANVTKENARNVEQSHPFSEIFKRFTSLADAGSHVSDLSSVHWPVSTRRTKFRINQMSSRDVPIFKTEKPAKLRKQNAIDANDMKIFDEQINRKSVFNGNDTKPPVAAATVASNCIADLLESFENDKNQLFQSHFRHKMKFIDRVPNGGSISFDCGQLGMEHRSINSNTIRSLFQLHATTGRNVKLIQAQIEAKNK